MQMCKIVSLKEAKDNGEKFYFTGKPCSRGHISLRYTKKRSCVECVREDSFNRSLQPKVREQNKRYKKSDKYKKSQKSYRSRSEVKTRECEQQKERRRKNLEKYLEIEAKSRSKNASKRRQYCRTHYARNKEYYRIKMLKFISKNPDYFLVKAKERTESCSRTNKTEIDQLVISEAVKLRRERKEQTGIEWHIDHIVPLKSKRACGLHNAANIQVVPAYYNLSKSNNRIDEKRNMYL